MAALIAAGCERIFREKASGGRWDRPQLLRLLSHLRTGDVVVVWKLDRLSRSLRDVLTLMAQLEAAGAGFRSVTEAIDTTTPAGRMLMHMVGAFAEFERAMLRERTRAGVEAARQEGRVGGRRPKLSPHQQAAIRKMVAEGEKTAAGVRGLGFLKLGGAYSIEVDFKKRLYDAVSDLTSNAITWNTMRYGTHGMDAGYTRARWWTYGLGTEPSS